MIVTGNGYGLRHVHGLSKFVMYQILAHNNSRGKGKRMDIDCHKFGFHNFSDGLICLPVDSSAENGYFDTWSWKNFEVTSYNKIIISVSFVLILVLAVVGNTLVIITVTTNKVMWTTMHLFIVSLAVSDTVVSITCIPLNIAQVIETDWIFSNLTCQLMTFFAQFGISASSLTLCCMACERYIAIVHPLKFGSLQTISRAIVVLIMVWILALASGAPYLYYSKVRQPPCFDRRKCKEELIVHKLCAFKEDSTQASINLHWLNFAIAFLIPMVVLFIAYGIIVYKLWIKAPVGVVMISVAGLRNRYKKKAVKMLLLVVLLFLLCWTPILIFDIVKLQHSFTFDGVVNLKYYLQCLAISSTAFNPFVYAFMNHKFRTSFTVFFTRRLTRVAPMTVPDQQKQGAVYIQTGISSPDSKSKFCSLRSTKSTQL
ncbi:hypothetical protein Btru_005717 [Bulinus truncatus]|nr:hypothetical protein Btru_005717 [Bulinus truncatus]